MPPIYLASIAILATLCTITPLIKSKKLKTVTRHSCLFLSILLLSIFYSDRSIEAGNDTIHYFNAFSHFKNLPLDDLSISGLSYGYISQEKGYSLISFALSTLTDFSGFLAIVAFLSILTSFIFYNRILKKDATLAFFALLCGVTSTYIYGGAIRQGLALPIAFIGFSFLADRKAMAGLAFLLIASLIHSSVLLFIPISIAATTLTNKQIIKSSRRVFTLFFISFLAFYLLSKYSASLGSFGGIFFQKIAYYLNYKGDSVGAIALTYPIIFFSVFYFIYDEAPKEIQALILIYGFIFSLQVLFKDAAEPFYRLGMYRFFIEPILAVFALRFFSKKFSIPYLTTHYPIIALGIIYCSLYTFTRDEVIYTLGL